MHRTGPIARRFPLVARARPPCPPLADRVDRLRALADTADQNDDLATASAVFNQAALLASDCGLPDLARQWCHRHTGVHLRALPVDARAARHALEPIVNLARLHIRAGHGDTAFHLLDSLFEAVDARTDVVIDGVSLPITQLTRTATDHRELRQWLWTVHLADGSRALTSIGRWQDAHEHLHRRHGIGTRMLDGRQVAVITHLTADNHAHAKALIDGTAAGEPWESAVTRCLAALCHADGDHATLNDITAMLEGYRPLPPTPSLAVFHGRLCLSVIDAAGGIRHPGARDLANTLIQQTRASRDGYLTRDVLAHDGCVTMLTNDQRRDLGEMLKATALGLRDIPTQLYARLTAALDTSEAVLARTLAARPQRTRSVR
ncbi:MAG: hypothetical protein HY241_00355 [Actinobacteria bacterium]|nr:hypothetical protein [Actinomycetota bacterium]